MSGHNLWTFGINELRVNGTVRAYTDEPCCYPYPYPYPYHYPYP